VKILITWPTAGALLSRWCMCVLK